eukprot:1308758-Prymnesium_polylepis.1
MEVEAAGGGPCATARAAPRALLDVVVLAPQNARPWMPQPTPPPARGKEPSLATSIEAAGRAELLQQLSEPPAFPMPPAD